MNDLCGRIIARIHVCHGPVNTVRCHSYAIPLISLHRPRSHCIVISVSNNSAARSLFSLPFRPPTQTDLERLHISPKMSISADTHPHPRFHPVHHNECLVYHMHGTEPRRKLLSITIAISVPEPLHSSSRYAICQKPSSSVIRRCELLGG